MHADSTTPSWPPVTHPSATRRTVLKAGATALAGLWLRVGSLWTWQLDPKHIYIAPDDHTDLFWTADEADYLKAFVEMLDYYLDLADATEHHPPDFQSRWNCDGSYWLWAYEKAKTAQEFERLIARIKDGHINAPLNALVVCLGGAPAEAVLRGMYYAGKIERRYNLRFPMAIAMENQTLPYGLGSLWAGAGAKYSWKGICFCDTRVADANDRPQEIYWWQGPDGSRILMKWNSLLLGSNRSIGGYAEAHYPEDVVEYLDNDSGFQQRYPYRVIGAFGKGWDDFKTMTDEFVTVAQDKTNAQRHVIVSNQADFFDDFEATYGGEIPTVSASYGNEWDLYSAAMAEVSASVRRSTEKLRAAEALATLVTLVDPTFMDGRESTRDQTWMDLGLFWEHNWGVVGRFEQFGTGRIAWQRRLADEIKTYVDQLHDDAADALGELIPAGNGPPRFYTFNPLGWQRTDIADLPYDDPSPVHVVDVTTGAEAPSQIVMTDGRRFLLILAQDVPAVGYKVFELRQGAGTEFPAAASVTTQDGESVIENDRYRVIVADRGAITSLVHRRLGDREFAWQSGNRFMNDLEDTGPGFGTLTVENAGPVSVTVLAATTLPLAHNSRITLIRDKNRIDIHNEITENFDDTYSWAFGFNVEESDVWYEEVGAIIRARLTTEGGHLAPQNARYDWLTLNHFADIGGPDGLGATLSNADCSFWKYGDSSVEELKRNRPQIAPLAGGRVVQATPDAGIANQGGDSYFLQRFALRTRPAYYPAGAMRFALEHQNPLVARRVTGTSRRAAYPSASYSLLHVTNPNVVLWALKPADDTAEVIARMWNLAPIAVPFALQFSGYHAASARQATHIETVLGRAKVADGALQESINAQQIKTFSLDLQSSDAVGQG